MIVNHEKHPISSEAVAMLRKRKHIKGGLQHIFVSKNIAQETDQKVEYSKHKGHVRIKYRKKHLSGIIIPVV